MGTEEDIQQLNQEFVQHKINCEKRFTDGSRQFTELTACLTKNTAAITHLAEETREIVEVYRDIKGVTKIGMSAQRFGLWLVKWPLIGTGAYHLYNLFTTHNPPH